MPIGSVLVRLPACSALAAAAASPITVAADATAHAAAERASMPAAVHEPLYAVRDMRPVESLWSVAECRPGDGPAWRTVARINDGRAMSDGTVFHADVFMQPGRQLCLPAPGQLSRTRSRVGRNLLRPLGRWNGPRYRWGIEEAQKVLDRQLRRAVKSQHHVPG